MCRLRTLLERSKQPGGFDKRLGEAWLLWFPCGIFGFHRFYMGHYKSGLLYLCTLGFCGVGWLLDACRMSELFVRTTLEVADRAPLVARGGSPPPGAAAADDPAARAAAAAAAAAPRGAYAHSPFGAEGLCALCRSTPAIITMMPCGHAALCGRCADVYSMYRRREGCPVCRAEIADMRVDPPVIVVSP